MYGKVRRDDLLFPELSYQLIGCAHEIYNQLGPGHLEKYYQRAFAVALKSKNLVFVEQVYSPRSFKGEIIGKMFFDFLVEDKIIIELKKDNRFSIQRIDQVVEYLKTSNHKLGILINFSHSGVMYKRIPNLY